VWITCVTLAVFDVAKSISLRFFNTPAGFESRPAHQSKCLPNEVVSASARATVPILSHRFHPTRALIWRRCLPFFDDTTRPETTIRDAHTRRIPTTNAAGARCGFAVPSMAGSSKNH
jgi:hypothetical protein